MSQQKCALCKSLNDSLSSYHCDKHPLCDTCINIVPDFDCVICDELQDMIPYKYNNININIIYIYIYI